MNLRGRNKVSPDFSMSSMTDIVFLLLIFFMLTSNSPNAFDALLPKASAQTTTNKTVSVEITKTGKFSIDNSGVSKKGLERALKNAMSGQSSPAVMVRAHKDVSYDNVIYVLDIAQRNKYKATLAVRKP